MLFNVVVDTREGFPDYKNVILHSRKICIFLRQLFCKIERTR